MFHEYLEAVQSLSSSWIHILLIKVSVSSNCSWTAAMDSEEHDMSLQQYQY